MRDIPLADLDAFATVARLRSFRGAAKVRAVSASSLSEAMRRLEERLGVRLFNRTTRSVTLTDAGMRLLDRVAPLMSELETALDDVNEFRDRPMGRLRLNVPGAASRTFLPDILSRFLADYPDIVVELSVNDTLVDVLAEGYDAGIRYEESLHQDMIAVPIGPRRQRYVCAASPTYLAEYGRPAHPRDLVAHRSVLHRFPNGRMLNWYFERGEESLTVTPPARLICEAFEVELAAAVSGLGILATFEEFVRPALDDGSLVSILDDWTEVFTGPYLYYPSRKYMPAPLKAFVDFVRQEGKAAERR
ncbi:LysR family transcriptional regulator [Ciceribacter sp. L1K23]|uniref:LysR family transcriptional regulator n=1 Tax=unclassified Ciceribacter TaxID=2628820 RepID=UPI001ABE171D|nr:MULTISPECIES: LysR family transcriptional regulator [unclassified Ciceribacter]MBO3760947.1 LysR family transcriptional regulator [Ciceribacter sp. L1K22]MBR0554977.1 LysR family transcriptional regulator [Ciceribacter sp. L1K23]